MGGGLQRVDDIAQHVRHDHFEGVLVAQGRRKVNLAVNRHTAARSDAVGDGVDDLPAAVSDTNFDVQILEEGVGQHTVVDLNRVVGTVAVPVGEDRVVEREGRWGRDARCLNVDDAFRVRGAARRVVAVRYRRGVPRDDPHFVGEITKARHETRCYVVDEVEIGDAPEAIGDGL